MTEKERSRQKFLARQAEQRVARLAMQPPRKPRRSQFASREEQHGRYIDCGPSAWDDGLTVEEGS